MVGAMLFMLPSVNDDIHRLLKERQLAEALDVSSRRLPPQASLLILQSSEATSLLYTARVLVLPRQVLKRMKADGTGKPNRMVRQLA